MLRNKTRNMELEPPFAIQVPLNSFTGLVIHFASLILEYFGDVIVAVISPALTLVFHVGYIPLGPMGIWPGNEDDTKN